MALAEMFGVKVSSKGKPNRQSHVSKPVKGVKSAIFCSLCDNPF